MPVKRDFGILLPAIPPSLRTPVLIVALFVGLSLAIYGQSLRNDFVRWDDGMLIYENPAIREITPRSLKRIFTTYDPELYIPLTFLTYQLEYRLVGTKPFLYHLDNLILHTLNALLVVWLVGLLLQQRKVSDVSDVTEVTEGKRNVGNLGNVGYLGNLFQDRAHVWALFAGTLFLLHPLHTEAVEWASARKDVLSAFFFLLSLIFYLLYRKSNSQVLGHKSYVLFCSSLLLFLLALLSKIMAITFPLLLLLLDAREGRPLLSKRNLREKAPFFGFALVFGLIAWFGKQHVVALSSLSAKVLMAGKSAVFYLQKIFIPTRLSLLYPYTEEITIRSADFFVSWLVVFALLLLIFVAWRRVRELSFGLLFFFFTVTPTFLNFAKGGDTDVYFASDRYSYLPSIGIFFIVASLLNKIIQRPAQDLGRRTSDILKSHVLRPTSRVLLLPLLFFCTLPVLAVLSFRQAKVWASTELLFENVLRYYPESSHVAHNNIGNVYRLRGDLDRAIQEYQKAITIRPHVRSLSNLGAAYRKKGMFEQAYAAYEKALQIAPQSDIAHYGLGIVYAAQGRVADARREYETAIRLKPDYDLAYANLGTVSLAEGKVEQAIGEFRKAIAINPFLAEAHYNLGIALTEAGRVFDAVSAYREVIRLESRFYQARLNLGLLLYAIGEREAAREQFEEVLEIQPGNPAARAALAQMGR